MSLIHDALRETGAAPAFPRPAVAKGSWWSRQPAGTRRLLPLAATALVAVPLLLVSGVRTLRADPPQPAAMASPTPASPAAAGPTVQPQPALDPNTLPLPLVAEALPEPALLPVETVVIEPASIEPAPAAMPAPTVAIATPAATHSDTPPQAPAIQPAPVLPATPAMETAPARQQIDIKVERRTAAATEGRQDETAVTQAVARVEEAMAMGDVAIARQALAHLEAQLPAESLTLLRMQAWVTHAGGNDAAAEKLYARISERVPGDLTAGVNLALLQARRGELDDARQRLSLLSGRHPRSPQVARALAELDATRP